LTAEPVALLVFEGTVVDVLVEGLDGAVVDGTVEVLAGGGVVVLVGGLGLVVDGDDELA
jgi:hypothetical protein